MKGLYLLLDGITLLFPLLLSFDSRVHYVSQWKKQFIAASIVAVPFLIWDIYFTAHGVWGFNSDYLVGLDVANLPIEELLFFWVVPFACTFIYECCRYYFQNLHWTKINAVLIPILAAYAILLLIQNSSGWYTISCMISLIVVLLFWRLSKPLPYLGIAFILSMIPFLAINGILTGSFIDAPIVWYSEEHFSNSRIFTIPMEDVIYSFSLISLNIFLFERLRTKELA